MFLNIVIFVVKIVDNMLSTGRTILTQKNKGFLAALTVVVSQIIFYKLMKTVMDDTGDLRIWIISLASGVGTYLAIHINNKFSRERTFIDIVTSNNKQDMFMFCEYLKSIKIKNVIVDSYDKNWDKTLGVLVITETKDESKLVDSFLLSHPNKFLRRTVNS